MCGVMWRGGEDERDAPTNMKSIATEFHPIPTRAYLKRVQQSFGLQIPQIHFAVLRTADDHVSSSSREIVRATKLLVFMTGIRAQAFSLPRWTGMVYAKMGLSGTELEMVACGVQI